MLKLCLVSGMIPSLLAAVMAVPTANTSVTGSDIFIDNLNPRHWNRIEGVGYPL